MNYNNAKKLLKDLKKLQYNINQVIKDLEEITKSGSYPKLISKTNRLDTPSYHLLQDEWNQLQKLKSNEKQITFQIDNFVEDKTKEYLTAFIKANSLPINPSDSKEKISRQLRSILHVGSIITGSVK